MKVQDIITSVDAKMDNIFGNQDKIDWLNEVEQDLYTHILEDFQEKIVNLPVNENGIEIDFQFEDIEKVIVNNRTYKKMSLKYYEPTSYYRKEGKLFLHPNPTEQTVVKIIYRGRPQLMTTEDMEKELILPRQFTKAYNYYLYAQILMLSQEEAAANNWIRMYNETIADYTKWYYDNKPRYATEKVNRKWR